MLINLANWFGVDNDWLLVDYLSIIVWSWLLKVANEQCQQIICLMVNNYELAVANNRWWRLRQMGIYSNTKPNYHQWVSHGVLWLWVSHVLNHVQPAGWSQGICCFYGARLTGDARRRTTITSRYHRYTSSVQIYGTSDPLLSQALSMRNHGYRFLMNHV